MTNPTSNETRPPISCYIRTKNEERMIGSVVEAALLVAREVIILDCGSTDATVAVAEAAGARVIQQPWLGNGFQKRVGEDACLYDLVLDLDADEIVTPELAAEIARDFETGKLAPVNGLKLVTVPPVGKPWLTYAIAYRNKLYDRRVVRQPAHAVWDQFDVPDTVIVRRLEGSLYHYSYHDLTHMVAKYNSYSLMRSQHGKRRSRMSAKIRIVFGLPVYFLKHYIQRGHYKNGVYGFSIAMLSAFGRWLSDAKTYENYLAADQAEAEGRKVERQS